MADFQLDSARVRSGAQSISEVAAPLRTLADSVARAVSSARADTAVGVNSDLPGALELFGKLWGSQASIMSEAVGQLSQLLAKYVGAVSDVDDAARTDLAEFER